MKSKSGKAKVDARVVVHFEALKSNLFFDGYESMPCLCERLVKYAWVRARCARDHARC